MRETRGKGYKPLLDGDVIEAGDEYWDPYILDWIKTVEHGKVVSNYPAMKYRRPTELQPYAADPGKGWRWLELGEEIQNGDEFRISDTFDFSKSKSTGCDVYESYRFRRKQAVSSDPSEPGDGWRWVSVDEDVCHGDECRSVDDPFDQWTVVKRFGGHAYGLCYRRKIEPPEPANDPVNHPKHYTSHPSGVECICITEHMGFNLGNVIKYTWRADEKGNALEDLEKARFYINREIAKRKKEAL